MRQIALFFLLLLPLLLPAQPDWPPAYEPEPEFRKVSCQSLYVPMRDGAQLAVDVCLPENLAPGQQIPTILHQTRYWRSLDLAWPFQGMADVAAPSLYILASCKELVRQGYAIVSVDARGTGASTGKRPFEMSPAEALDGKELMDWIVEQPWSDGNIGSIGISYNGWAAQMLAMHQHPALKCIVPYNAPFDGWQEMSYPGGLYNHYLMEEWSSVCADLDQNIFPSLTGLARKVVKGFGLVRNTDNAPGREALLEAHSDNEYATAFMPKLPFRDSKLQSARNKSLAHLFPVGHLKEINARPIPVYSISGWYDMTGAHSAARQFLNYQHPDNRLMIGPWNHGGAQEVSPFQKKARPISFPMFGELLRFFDRYLKDRPTGIDQEAPVHYFVMGQEVWKQAETWPPQGTTTRSFFLNEKGELRPHCPDKLQRMTVRLDTTTYTGRLTRWEIDRSSTTTFDRYWESETGKTAFESAPVEEGLEITGHPTAYLYLSSEAPDASLYLWLEDVAPDGTRRLITQGQLRLAHRQLSPDQAPFADVVPYRSFAETDTLALNTGQTEEVVLSLAPTAWYLHPGHRLRLQVTGSDRDHFDLVQPGPVDIDLHFAPSMQTRLELPVQPSTASRQ